MPRRPFRFSTCYAQIDRIQSKLSVDVRIDVIPSKPRVGVQSGVIQSKQGVGVQIDVTPSKLRVDIRNGAM